MKLRTIVPILLLLLLTGTFGEAASIPASFQNITTFEGLPSNTIGALKKDSLGFIWIGTKQGLCRFDGCSIQGYPLFAEDNIWCIEELDKENLAIGTISRLKIFNRKTNTATTLDIPSGIVKAVKKTDTNQFLAGTTTGLYLVSDQHPQKILFNTGLSPSNHITSIVRENKYIYWFSTEDGLGRLDLRTQKTNLYKMESGTSNNNFFTSLTRVGNHIYLGSFNKGVFDFHIPTRQFTPVKGFEHNLIMTMDHQNGLLCVGTNGQGLKVLSLKDGQIETISHKEKKKQSIGSNTITAFLHNQGIWWIGTQFGGLSYTPSVSKKFTYYEKDGFYSTDYNIRSFCLRKNGDRLIGTRTGLFYISEKNNSVRHYSLDSPTSRLRSDIIPYIAELNGQILFCTYGGGVYRFDEKTLTLSDFSKEEPFQYGCFFHFVKDLKGHIWFASTDGLYQCSPEGRIIKKYDTTNSGLTNNTITFLWADSVGRLWIGTHFGLFLMDMETGKIRSDCFRTPIDAMIKYIMEDSQKNIWVCTENGLFKIRPNLVILKQYTKQNLLPDNKVISIQEDQRGNYWIATLKEITKYNPKTHTHYTYRQQDGLSGLDFNNNVSLSTDGTLWWANEGGLICTSDRNQGATHKEKTHPPLITSYTLAGIEYDPVYKEQIEEVVLPESPNSIRFKFSDLNYSLPYANVYEYQLEGYDSTWIKQTGINEVTYTDLPSGNYVFKLRAPGNPNEIQEFPIRVRKSYTYFAGVTLICILIATLIFYFYRRIRRLKRHIQDERMILQTVQQQKKTKDIQAIFPEVKASGMIDALLTYIEEEKPYLNSRLSIGDLSSKIGCTESELSQLLNNHMKINFANFINIYRVNEVKIRLNEENLSKYTLKALSEQCGFNSKTTFYRVFKNVTGMTPSEYCKSLNISIKEN